MSVAGFFVTNLAGTLVRLYLIRRLGETFESPIDDLLGYDIEWRQTTVQTGTRAIRTRVGSSTGNRSTS